MYFHGVSYTSEELANELKKEVVFPEDAKMTIHEVYSWALSRIPTIEAIMATHGYYDAHVDFFVDVRSTPPVIYYNIKPGPLFTLGAFALRAEPAHYGPVAIMAQDIEQFGAKLGMPANKYKIQDAKKAILRKLGDSGFPFAKITGERVVLNRTKKTMLVSFRVRANKLVRYGNIYLEGSSGVKAPFLKRFINWEKGDVYNKSKVENTAQQLMDTGAFKDVYLYLDKQGQHLSDLTPEEIELEQDAPSIMLDMHFNLVPKPATIVRLKASSSEESDAFGFEGARFNSLQRGETIRIDTEFSPIKSKIAPRMLVPNLFGYMGVQSVTSLDLNTEKYPGFSTASVRAKQAFDYTINKYVGLTFGVGFEYCRYPELHISLEDIKPNASWDAFAGVVFRNVDNPIQPTTGWHLKFIGKGSIGMLGHPYRMSRLKTSARFFLPLNRRKTLVWENWLRLFFTPTHTNMAAEPKPSWDIPVHRLFYVGGPRGVRGYRRQPFSRPARDFVLKPHYSMLMCGSQIRYAFNKRFSMAAFVDVGETFEPSYPSVTWPMHYSVGGNARLITDFGALSFTLATALHATPYSTPLEYSIAFSPIWSS